MMYVKCTCPYCSKVFTINVEDVVKPKQKRTLSPEIREKKAALMRERRANGWGGNHK